MECEVCGQKGELRKVLIDGVVMRVCDECSKFGVSPREKTGYETSQREERTPYITPSIKPRKKKNKRAPRDYLKDSQFELVENFAELIREARESRDWTQEELGDFINEKASLIAKIERGMESIDEKLLTKLERKLKITLRVPVVNSVHESREEISQGPTLGDIVRIKAKKKNKKAS